MMRRLKTPLSMIALSLAAAGCGGEPGGGAGGSARSPEPATGGAAQVAWFDEQARRAGLHFGHSSGFNGRHLFPEILTGGAALFDMDGDGDLDAYLVQAGSVLDSDGTHRNRMFRNDGTGNFADVTSGSGADDPGYGMGVTTGDYDNDGDVDLYVTNLERNTLLRNDGQGRFTDVTESAGVGDTRWSTSAAFLDFDQDGDLDLYVTNYVVWSESSERACYTSAGVLDYCSPRSYEAPARDTFYRNEGDGTFTDISEFVGLDTVYGNGLGVVTADFDDNGYEDVYVANDGTVNQIWLTQPDGTFKEGSMRMGCGLDADGVAKAGMGVTADDVDDDGDIDLLVVNLMNESDSFYRNHDGAYFTDDTAETGMGVGSKQFTRFGLAFVDLDNDSWLDIFEANGRVEVHEEMFSDDPYAEPNLVFRGRVGGGGWDEVLPRGGTATPVIGASRAAAFGDVNGDGGIDVLVVNRDGPAHLLINTVPDAGAWAMLRVVDEHGRDALGARVTARLDDRTLTRQVRTAYSYCAANDPRVHFGLGAATSLDDVTVTWTDGTRETFGAIPAGAVTTLRRGAGSDSGSS